MKIIVKTLKGSHFGIDVRPEYTVAEVKKCIEIVQGSDLYPAAQQMLVHNGKVLKDESTLEENKVADNSFVIIMLCKPKRQSQLYSGYNQQGFCPRGPATSQWGPRGPHLSQPTGYDYQHRGSYPSQNQQYPRPTYGNYPPHQQAPRSNFGWDQRPPSTIQAPSPQGGYGQPQGPDYAQPTLYSRTAHPAQSYGHGYNEPKYENQAPPQQAYGGQAGQQPVAYPQAQSQVFNFSLILPYQGPVSSTQSYGPNATPQQPYPYASSGPIQQSYPPYGSAPAADGYRHPPPASVYSQPAPTQPGYDQTVGYGSAPVGYDPNQMYGGQR